MSMQIAVPYRNAHRFPCMMISMFDEDTTQNLRLSVGATRLYFWGSLWFGFDTLSRPEKSEYTSIFLATQKRWWKKVARNIHIKQKHDRFGWTLRNWILLWKKSRKEEKLSLHSMPGPWTSEMSWVVIQILPHQTQQLSKWSRGTGEAAEPCHHSPQTWREGPFCRPRRQACPIAHLSPDPSPLPRFLGFNIPLKQAR